MNAPRERRLRVGHGLFDPLSGELSMDGGTVKLRPRTAALLSHLVRNADRAVGKDELMQAVWPDVVVTEDSLVQCVKEIRHALGQPGRDWIRTLPRQGYAFVGNPDQPAPLEPAAAPSQFDGEPATVQRAMPARWRQLAAFGFIAFVLAGALAIREWRNNELARSPAPPLSIVVLPIVNQTGDPALENTADGITETLTDALARAAGTTVIAPGTAFTFKGSPVDARRVGAELNVRYVLEGALRMDASRPVLTMRLADASTAVQLWNQEFRPAAMPAFRDLVVGRVAETLGLQLIRAEARQGDRSRPVPPQTVELMSRARAALREPSQGTAGALQARSLLEDSVRHDDRSAETWAMLATTYLRNVRFSASREFEIERAGQAVQRALALAPDSDAVRLAEGRLYYEQKRMPQALIAFERATELNPNNAPAHAFRATALIGLGRADESLAAIDRAIRLSPRDPQLWFWHLITGVAHLHLRHDGAAVEWLTRSVKVDSRNIYGRLYLACALGVSGRIPEAQVHMAELQRLFPGVTLSRIRATEPSDAPAFRKQRERIYEGLRRAGMPE